MEIKCHFNTSSQKRCEFPNHFCFSVSRHAFFKTGGATSVNDTFIENIQWKSQEKLRQEPLMRTVSLLTVSTFGIAKSPLVFNGTSDASPVIVK